MKKSHFTMLFGFIVMALFMLSCENNLEMVLPQGPKGDKGDKGDPGKSAFELWIEHYGKDPNTSIEEFFNSLKGVDGKDGAVPVIGSNGNWFIDGVDTGIPARGRDGENGVTPEIGENGNWIIGGVDTGIPARGEDGANGVDGKSAYELWKEAVDRCDGTVTNKDGSPYDCSKNTWEDFLIWLQGGDVSVLHRYWITLPGNEGKTIEQFIEELFDCHCDGITVSVITLDECVELNSDGTLRETYNAELRVGGTGGTQVQVTGNGVNLSGNISDATIPLVFTIPRGDESIQLTIDCTQSGNTVTKNAVIPALNYVKLAATPTVTQVSGQQQDVATIQFATAPVELSVDGAVVYQAGNIVAGSGWAVSNEGRTFTRTYDRIATEQNPTIRATGDNDACSTIEGAFTIPQLSPVEVGEFTLSVLNDCFLSLSFSGTSGMTVTAMDALNPDNPNTSVTLTESPSGTYTTSVVPRLYDAYTILVKAELDGYGTVEETIEVEGIYLAPVAEPLTISQIPGVDNNTSIALVQRRFTNNTDGPLTVRVIRGNNSNNGALRHPQSLAFPFTAVIPANDFIDGNFYRDYTETFAAGQYVLTFTTTTECGLQKNYTLNIDNQQNYRHAFTLPPGWGDGSGDPNELIAFEVSVFDGIPGSYIEFQLFNGTAYGGVSRTQLDGNGNLTWNVTTMTRAQIQAALDNEKGFFYFFSDPAYTTKYSIGADKEEVTFAFE